MPAPETLPISARRLDLIEAMRRHDVIVVSGDTGSGKTTQLPQMALEALNPRGLIGCTQPRRLAATSVAKRVAEERRCPLGEEVGFQVRFHEQVGPRTRIKFMTDGILLAETKGDPQLRRYGALIVDEAHERSLNIDFLLGYLKDLLPRRRDLKVVISSATLDTERFSRFFDNCPILEIEGRSYPVEDYYLPAMEGEDLPRHAARAVEWIREMDTRGDVLIFLPGEREIRETTDVLEGRRWPRTMILPLYARLGIQEQQVAFQPSSLQRIILATNVAETSLTIPGIVYVVDSGLARINRYQPQSRLERLQTERVSQASARQRRGRCGRVTEGICVKLYEERDLANRPAYTDPEIRRSSLSGVILQMLDLGLPPIEEFPFLEPPPRRQVQDGYRQLEDLRAIRSDRRLTEVGREMAKLPVDPALAKMLVHAREHEPSSLPYVLIIASALSIQDPRERPLEKQQAADEAHAKFKNQRSDFLSHVAIWLAIHGQGERALSGNQLRRFCQGHFLSYRRVMEWIGVHRELAALMRVRREQAAQLDRAEDHYAGIHRCILAGMPREAAHLDEAPEPAAGGKRDRKPNKQPTRFYRAGGGQAFLPFPGSGLAKRKNPPEYVVAFEIVETSRTFARQLAEIEPSWLETVAPHLCRSRFSDPYWNSAQGAVYAREHVTCAGLPILQGRPVHFGRIDPAESRRTFIWQGLIPGDLRVVCDSLKKNLAVVESVRLLEAKLRRPDSLYCAEGVFEFYDRVLPPDICTTSAFEQWRAAAEKANPNILRLREEDARFSLPSSHRDGDFPDELRHQGLVLPLAYRYAPGEDDDGLGLTCVLEELPRLPDWLGDWLVPGYLREKAAILIRALPKHLKLGLNEPDKWAAEFVGRVEPAGPLADALAKFLTRAGGELILPQDFPKVDLAAHLRMRFTVVEKNGQAVAVGRDLAKIRAQVRPKLAHLFQTKTGAWEQTGLKDFPGAALPPSVDLGAAVAFPALVDEGKSVGVKCYPAPEAAGAAHRIALARLIELKLPDQVAHLRKSYPLGTLTKLQLPLLGRAGKDNLGDLVLITIDAALGGREFDPPPIRDADTFAKARETLRGELFGQAQKLAKALDAALQEYDAVARIIEQHRRGPYEESVRDAAEQVDDLFQPRFFLRGWGERLQHYPRYFKALRLRLERMLGAPAIKDTQKLARVKPFAAAYRELATAWETRPLDPPFALRRFGWQLQEFRLAVFAPEIPTAIKVSEKRLEESLAELRL